MSKIIEVGFKKNVIPVRIGGLDFELPQGEKFRRTYMEQLANLNKNVAKRQEELAEAAKNEDLDAINDINNQLFDQSKNFTDAIFGQGSFDKMFAICDDADVIIEAVSDVIEQASIYQNEQLGKSYITGKKG